MHEQVIDQRGAVLERKGATVVGKRARHETTRRRGEAMVGDTIEPRASHSERFREPYLRLIDELERRGWLDPELASHCHRRAGR